MSSATPYNPGRVKRMLNGLAGRIVSGTPSARNDSQSAVNSRVRRLGMSPRQQTLNWLYSWYKCSHYSTRKCDWTGKENLDPIEHEAIAAAGSIPPGFYDAGEMFPLKFRKPTAAYHLPRVIVDRFTGLLFSERRHPRVIVLGDKDTTDYVNAIVDDSRLWALMILARQYGGSMGTTVIGFQFENGKPVIEVHDPRWVRPIFANRLTHKLKAIEKRYMYPQEEEDPSTGTFVETWYWYRRVIDENKDVLFAPTPVGDGEEPKWVVENVVAHNLGFCPVVWVQNLPVQDDIDGDPDCEGIFETIESIDALLAQADKGLLKNCDPTAVVSSPDEFAELKKGSDNAIKLSAGDAHYMEISGTGPKAAYDAAAVRRAHALEVAQCVLEHPDVANKTATEIERTYESMISKADVLREQYGQKGIIPLLEMMLKAARKLGAGTVNTETGEVEKQVLDLTPREVLAGEAVKLIEQEIGEGERIMLKWPRYFEATLMDVDMAGRAAGGAKATGLIDAEHAVNFVAEFFHVEDPRTMLKQIIKERDEVRGQMQAAMADRIKLPKT